MALVSIAKAAKLVGKSRQSLYSDIDKGRLSVGQDKTGKRQVDTSELMRVYGELQSSVDSQVTVKFGQELTANLTTDTGTKIAVLEAENAQLKERLADKEKNLEDLRSTVRLLEHKQARPWWKIW